MFYNSEASFVYRKVWPPRQIYKTHACCIQSHQYHANRLFCRYNGDTFSP